MASVILNFFQKLSPLRALKSRQILNESAPGQLNKSENKIKEIVKILSWNDPFLSTCCVILVNIVYWLIVYIDFKFYGIIFTIMLILVFEQFWREHLSRLINKYESDSKSETSPRISISRIVKLADINNCLRKSQTIIKNAYDKAKLFRQEQPGMFCVLTCLCFLMLSIVGRSISGVLSLYILLMLTMTVPGVFIHLLPPGVISSFSNFIISSRKDDSNDNDDDVEPYLPDTSQEAMELLRLAGDISNREDEDTQDLLLEQISARTNDTESLCSKSSLLPESSLMPSAENSMDFSELDLALGSARDKSDSNDSESNDINFQSKHFDGDSSEEEFALGLKFSDKDSKKDEKENKTESDKNTTAPSVLNSSNLISRGTNLLTNLVNRKNFARNDRESSSDTDSFEMISEEDM